MIEAHVSPPFSRPMHAGTDLDPLWSMLIIDATRPRSVEWAAALGTPLAEHEQLARRALALFATP